MAENAPQHVRAPDGRTIEILSMPSGAGWTLVYQGGTPAAPVSFVALEAAAAARGMRLVQYARPGYGGSERRAGRRVADAAVDVADVLDALGVDRCLTLGWSGGGPHALACAALLPERVAAAATIASPAPYGAEGLDFFAGMSADNVEELGAALAGPEQLRTFLEALAPSFSSITAEQVASGLGDLASEEDRNALTGEFAEHVAQAFRRALSSGIWGWYDDDLELVQDWGFDLASIQVPVTIWQGEHDRMVPIAHGRWLVAHVPGRRSRLLRDHGHMSLMAASLDRILDDLLERAGGRT
ncbi:MAG: alpha/beta hydrolase [Candidatus Limnocylindrales bacterium]